MIVTFKRLFLAIKIYISLKFQGRILSVIEKIMKRSRCAVCPTLKRFIDIGFFFDRIKTGRNLKPSAITDRLLKRLVKVKRRKMCTYLSSELAHCHNVNTSSFILTVRR